MANTALGDIKVHKKTNKLKRVFLGRGDHCSLACVFWCCYCSASVQSFVLRHLVIRDTQQSNVSKYARGVSDGFLYALEAFLVNLELP